MKSLSKFILYILVPVIGSLILVKEPIVNYIYSHPIILLIMGIGICEAFKNRNRELKFPNKATKPGWFNGNGTNKYVDNNPDKGRKKILGITIPALFTDFWHLMVGIQTILLCLSILLYNTEHTPVIEYLIIYCSYKYGFNVTYNTIV